MIKLILLNWGVDIWFSNRTRENIDFNCCYLSSSQKPVFDPTTVLFDLSTCVLSHYAGPLERFLFHYRVLPAYWAFVCQLFLYLPCVPVRVMENEEGRKEYLVFPPSKSQCPASSQKGRKIPLKGNGRRIDYILYSDEGLQQDWKLVRFSGTITIVQFFGFLQFAPFGCPHYL